MTDIVERLRLFAKTGNYPSQWPHAMREAADAIERLDKLSDDLDFKLAVARKELSDLRSNICKHGVLTTVSDCPSCALLARI